MRVLVFLLGLLWNASSVAAAEKYVVVESPPLKLRAEEKSQVLFAIADELRNAGCEVTSGQESKRGACTTPECWKAVAAAANATDVLVVSGGYAKFEWRLSFEHRNASGTRVDMQNKDCEYCRLPSIVEWARAAVKQSVEAARAQATAAIPEVQPVAPPPPAAHAAPALKASTPAPHSFFWPPWALVGVGAVAIGYGGWALHKDSQDAGSCAPTATGQKACNRYDSKVYGVIGLAGGGALALGGVLWALLAPPDAPAVSVSLNHVAVTVRF